MSPDILDYLLTLVDRQFLSGDLTADEYDEANRVREALVAAGAHEPLDRP